MKKNISLLKVIFFCSAVVVLGNCGSLEINVPDPMIESPDLVGKEGSFEFGLGSEDSTIYKYTNDASSRPPVLTNPEVSHQSNLYGRGGYSLFDWLEIGVRLLPGDVNQFFLGGLGATARAQLIGVGPSSGIKFAIYGGALRNSTSTSGTQNGNFGPGGYNWRSSAKALTLTTGASLGYKFESDVLCFIAASYADQNVSGQIDHDLSSNGTSPAASYTLTDVRGNTRTAAVGARFGKTVQLGVEARAIHRSWPGTSNPEIHGGGESTEGAYSFSLNFR